jgi:hypothetical protein
MVDLEKLSLLVQDQDNKLRFTLIKKDLNYHVYIEKLHSINQWINIFLKEFLEYDSNSILKGDIDKDSILVMNYLSLCNGIVDSYMGLNRILNDMQNDNYTLVTNTFKKTRKYNLEHDKFFGYTKHNDFQYFKHIRAVFGQHPSNLDYKENGENKRAFSSWPFHDSMLQKTGCDLYTNVYYDISRQGWGIRFHLFLKEVETFINQVLESINLMILRMGELVDGFISDNCPGIIFGFDAFIVEDKIKALSSEIYKRYSFDDYHYLLEATKTLERMFFHGNISGYEVETDKFIEDINISLDEIHSIVSMCGTGELFYYEKFYSDVMDSIGHHYFREKCAMYILGDIRYMDIFQTVNDQISKILKVSKSYSFGDFYYRLYLLQRLNKKAYV